MSATNAGEESEGENFAHSQRAASVANQFANTLDADTTRKVEPLSAKRTHVAKQ